MPIPTVAGRNKLRKRTASRSGRTASSRERSGDIRAWAKDRSIPVSHRGRIPASVLEQYEAAT